MAANPPAGAKAGAGDRQLAALAVVVGIACVGAIDYLTGSDIHVNAFYFVPLAYAGARLGRRGAMFASLLAAITWTASFHAEQSHASPLHVYFINFVLQGTAFCVIAMLVARLSELLARETHTSRRDGLTGLHNRSAFFEQAGRAVEHCRRSGRPVAVAFIDLDGFKRVNDAYGHARGDEVLRACAANIEASRRDGDIAARLGGDEFVMLLPATDGVAAERLLERMRERLDRDAVCAATRVTASVGIVVDPTATASLDVLIAHADQQMYGVKRSARRECRAYVIDAMAGGDASEGAVTRDQRDASATTSFAGIRLGRPDRRAG